MPPRRENSSRVAIVGASSLLGKELKQVLEDRHFPASDILLLDTTVMAGTLTDAAGEPTFIRALEEDSFEGVRFAFFAGSVPDTEQNWAAVQRARATVIDLTGALAAAGRAIHSIPSLSRALSHGARSGAGASSEPAAYASPGAPVVIACTLAAALGKLSPQRVVLVLFPPVSERGQAGVDELESQATNLLSFREISQPIFDTQVAFNLLVGYGESSKPQLAEMRGAIVRDVTQYLAGRGPLPAIQLLQAPVFYGYAFSAYAEFASPVKPEQLRAAFANLGVEIGAPDDPLPTNVSVAGESEIHLALMEPDTGIAAGMWLWGAADNLRLAATNAVRIAEELLAKQDK